MKQLFRKILGYPVIYYLKKVKRNIAPNASERALAIREKAELIKNTAFYARFIDQNDFCFDIGANFGNRIKPLLKIGAKVLAVEPQEACYEFLQMKFGKEIILVTKGIGSKEEVKDFYISNMSTISSFSQEWIKSVKENRFKNWNWDESIQIEMTTIDNLISLYGKPTFIKIDVEGYELEVLKGLSQGIKLVSFEYTVPEQIDQALNCISRLQEIDNNIELNYCIDEKMKFALSNWISAEDMKTLIRTEEFIETYFGDIYVRNKSID